MPGSPVTTISTVNSRASSSALSLGARRSGSSSGVSAIIIATPATANGSPTAPISKIPMASSPASSSSPETTRFVEVPIRVTVPPTIAAKLTGMR